MGLDATIKHLDGEPLGDREMVLSVLRQLWPTAEFGEVASGLERVQEAARRGCPYPPGLAEALAGVPATMAGVFEGSDYFVELRFTIDPVVDVVDVVLRGNTEKSEPITDRLRPFGWTITFP